ncbi:hypothetical protein, partial [Glutamicibacter sp. V16R2B1]|uniref:hypothetical protein n=1 Tax=Glutamicibacter sp. V16R2B1 TaxID=2036207 RepID=UPI0014857B60
VPPVELAVSRGVIYPDGTRELIPLGVLVVSSVDPELRTKFSIGVNDRSRRVARNAFWRTYVIPAGTSYIQAIRDLVVDRLRYDVDVQIATSNEFVTLGPVVYTERDDPWKAVQALAATIGCEVFFDQIGRLIIRDRVLAMGSPDWRYDGTNSWLLPETRVAVADEPGYNAVLAVGESSGNTTDIPRALAVDSDPTSPTFWNGDEYGQVTEIYSDSSIADVDHAALVARTRLAHWLGRNDAMTAATVPHPAHDAGDVLATTWLGVDRTVPIASLTMPLDVGTAATLTCRSQIALEAA